MKPKTIEDIEALDKLFLTAEDVAGLFPFNANSLRLQAHSDRAKLGFLVIITNRDVHIPKGAFVRWYRKEVLGECVTATA